MRTDIIWPVVWGTCFVGGMILGSTGPVNVLAFGSSSPKLRGSEHATETVSENVVAVEQRQLQLQQEDDGIMAEARTVAAADDAIPATALTTARALGSSDFDAGFDEDRLIQAGASVYGGPSTVAQRVHELNGGLWGPNQEEEKEIALELSRLREEAFRAPTTSSSEGDRYELPPSTHSSYSFSFSYDFEAGGTSFSYDYEFPRY